MNHCDTLDYLADVTVEPPRRPDAQRIVLIVWARIRGERAGYDALGDFYHEFFPSQIPYPYRCANCARLTWQGYLGPSPYEFCLACVETPPKAMLTGEIRSLCPLRARFKELKTGLGAWA